MIRLWLLTGLLSLTGCSHRTALKESFLTASYEIPCGDDNCGKTVVWEYFPEPPVLAQANP